eukprot:gnl/MRDRNA2_/MRDRNA2_65812_c0_seq1.p1 gnl/MRDRNA2_/MRDRNA2_65812_c0~~gnl/MRDRNA2_/MRDRNA2_65812_c0_seq1.p1  ORF type:complete len:656 (+),score=109.62 gnl/MRDRNA2_/MRDRNA2_65812_c0_seq1:101-2068(+)
MMTAAREANGQPLLPIDAETGSGQGTPSLGRGFSAIRARTRGSDSELSLPDNLGLEWRSLNFSIKDKEILKNVTGLIEPGKLCAILGPSGSGKSTLLNILAARQNTSKGGASLTGDISVCGTVAQPADFRSNIAYVMQDDSLVATETPRECLEFSAKLRGVAQEDQAQHVLDLLNSLGLAKCSETLVGNDRMKGVSGGERKRTSVGVELVTQSAMLFLDEPLSGLDAYAAYTVVETLRDIANSGVPVLCTVHQPSSEIFQAFDDVIIIHDGEIVFQGPTKRLPGYLSELGHACPQNFNPADHVMFMLQKESVETTRRIKDHWHQSSDNGDLVRRIGAAARVGGSFSLETPKKNRRNFLVQVGLLVARERRAVIRNKAGLGARFGMSIFLALLYSWLFAGLGNGENCQEGKTDPGACAAAFQAHFGTLVSLGISAMMGSAQPVLLTFPLERPIFVREYASNYYGTVAYFLAKTLVELPLVFFVQLLMFSISYPIMKLQGNFIELVLAAWLLAIASSSLALIVSCAVTQPQSAIQFGPLVLIPQMLFAGLFLPVGSIPSSLQWMQYLCPLKYAINLFGQIEFHHVKAAINKCDALSGIAQVQCKLENGNAYLQNTLLENQNIYWTDWSKDLGLLLGLLVGFRVLATFLLWRKGSFVF